jgi:hypothetical protein
VGGSGGVLATGGSGGGSGGGGSAGCTDTMSDGHNCGACGHDCLGGACELGVCQPVPIASNQGPLFLVYVDASYVYWGGDGGPIGRAPKNGTGAAVPLTGGFYAYEWAVAGGRIYWANDWQGLDVESCGLPDCAGGAAPAGVGSFGYYALASDPTGTRIFWSAVTSTTTVVQGMTVTSGAKTPALASGRSVFGMAADDNYLYFGAGDTHTVEKVAVAGGQPSVMLAVTPGSPGAVAVCGAHLYWVDGQGVYSTPLPNGTGSAGLSPFGTGPAIFGLACDDTGVYWANHVSNSGTVVACPHAGCGAAPKVLALGQDRPWGIAADAQAVYWVTEGGNVLKVAK